MCGRLGENIYRIYGLFYFCIENDIPLNNIFINKNRVGYDFYGNKSYPLLENIEMFDNIKQYLVDIDNEDFHTFTYSIIPYNKYVKYKLLDKILVDKNDNYILDDYWHFPMNRKLFHTLFKPPKLITQIKEKFNYIDFNTSCSLHIRRKDFQLIADNKEKYKNLFYKIPPSIENIENAIKISFSDKHIEKIICFSDDITWCKENLRKFGNKIIYIEGTKTYEDLFLLSLCKYSIIVTNSQFYQTAILLSDKFDPKNEIRIKYI